MPNYLRPKVSGATVFFTVALADRDSDLLVREIDHLRAAVRVTKTEYPFEIDTWVVLPDHMHCLWHLPHGDHDFSTRWRLIKSRFSRALPKGPCRPSHVKRHERGIWQRRFWERHMRSAEELCAHRRHCWTNPVRHGWVQCPEAWPFSSLHGDPRYVRNRPVARHAGGA